MKFKLLHKGEQKTYAIVLKSGERIMECLREFAKMQNLHAAQFTAIGALREVTVGFFNFDRKDYKKIFIKTQVEVLSLMGDVTVYDNEPKIHAHIVVGKEDGTAHGGHLLEGAVHPTLEVILTESPAHLEREMDDELGIPLIKIQTYDFNPVPQ